MGTYFILFPLSQSVLEFDGSFLTHLADAKRKRWPRPTLTPVLPTIFMSSTIVRRKSLFFISQLLVSFVEMRP